MIDLNLERHFLQALVTSKATSAEKDKIYDCYCKIKSNFIVDNKLRLSLYRYDRKEHHTRTKLGEFSHL